MLKKRILRLGGLMAIVIGLAAGPAAPAAAQTKTPLYGGTLVVGMASEPATLNIALTTNLPESIVSSNIYNKLISLGPDEKFYPELAKSWDVSPDALVYTFHLNEGVKWHDGQPFSSADVKFSLENLTKPFHPQGALMFPKVKSIEAPDPNTVVLTLNTPSEPFISYLALRAYILPKHIYEKGDVRTNPANAKPVGTGPYKFVEWQRGSHIILEKNPNYFMKGQPYLDRFVYRIMPDPAARVLAMESGEIDYMTHDVPSASVSELKKNSKIVVSGKGVESLVSTSQLMMNLDRAPFKDVRVRRAIAMAVDRNFLAERAALGLFKPATSPISSETAWAYNPNVRKYPYDKAAAEKLLDEAGLKRGPDGVRFKTVILGPRGRDDQVKAAEIIAQQLKEVGIAASVSIIDTAALADISYVKRDFDMMVNTVTTGPDPAIGVQRQYTSENVRPVPFTNASGYKNPEVDKLFAEAEVAPTREERAVRYRKIQDILVNDIPVLWLWEVVPISAWRTDFEGIHDWSPAAPYYLYRAWSVKGKKA
jgi:peptide/nickel transport system substrate-binding protein